jgi:predicted homoserine dehydrogenase-like protein
MGSGIALQIITAVKGMRLVAISNRTASRVTEVYQNASVERPVFVDSTHALEDTITRGEYAYTDNPELLCDAENVDVLIEATGDVEFAAHVVMRAIEKGKHVVLMNAELDAAVGPILKVYADRAGVVYTNSDGDQPGVIMNLYRYVKSIGFRPVLAGNMKGLQDPYRTPETQKGYAEKYHLSPTMATAFADGTKVSMEMAVVANATGLRAGRRGMYGPECGHVQDTVRLFPMDQLLDTGLVDYILGAEPAPGVFILGYQDNPIQQRYLNYYKMGEGPLYVFYTPYHLCHFEVPLTAARAALFHDAAVSPLGGPVCDVVTVAKKDLKKGEKLDGIGGFTCYGVLDNYGVSGKEKLLPMSFSSECVLDELREEQSKHFGGSHH